MAHRKRVSAYRRQGVSAFAYLLKLTSANRSRFTFCFQQNAKSRNFMAVGGGVSAGGVSALGRRGNVSAYRRVGERRLEHTHAVSGPDERFEQEGEPTPPETFRISEHARPT